MATDVSSLQPGPTPAEINSETRAPAVFEVGGAQVGICDQRRASRNLSTRADGLSGSLVDGKPAKRTLAQASGQNAEAYGRGQSISIMVIQDCRIQERADSRYPGYGALKKLYAALGLRLGGIRMRRN